MHPARKTAAVLIVLTFILLFLGILYGAVTEGDAGLAGGWIILGVSSALLVAAWIALIVWRVRR